jgi:hypothetical protein
MALGFVSVAAVMVATILAAVWLARQPHGRWPGRAKDVLFWACATFASGMAVPFAIMLWTPVEVNRVLTHPWDAILEAAPFVCVGLVTGWCVASGIRRGAIVLGPAAASGGLALVIALHKYRVYSVHPKGLDWPAMLTQMAELAAVALVGVLLHRLWVTKRAARVTASEPESKGPPPATAAP